MDPNICNFESFGFFKSKILKFIRLQPNIIYNWHIPKEIRLTTRLSLVLSHLRKHKFKHSFQDYLNPLCLCGIDIETSSHFLLHCPRHSSEKMTLLNKIKNTNYGIIELSNMIMTKTVLFLRSSLRDSTNTLILNSIDYVIVTERLDGPIVTSLKN